MRWFWRLMIGLTSVTWLVAIMAMVIALRFQTEAVSIATLPATQAEPLITPLPTPTPTVNIWLLPTITAIPTNTSSPTPLPTALPTPTETAIVYTPAPPPLTATPAAWIIGGSLHQSTVAEWRSANRENQVATIRDWVATGFNLKAANLVDAQAQPVITCIDTSLTNYALTYSEQGSMSNLAWLCMMAVQGKPLIYPPAPAPTPLPTLPPTPTPYIIVVTPTPYVVTATPLPPTPYIIVVTATPLPATPTPYIIVVTATPLPPTLMPDVATATPPFLPTLTPTTIWPILSGADAANCDCSGDLYNCPNFVPRTDAQLCFDHCVDLGASDIHKLDGDNDNLACEPPRD